MARHRVREGQKAEDTGVPDLQDIKDLLKVPRLRFSEATDLKSLIFFSVLLLAGLGLALIDFNPDLSGLHARILSGSTEGQYSATVDTFTMAAERGNGFVKNVQSQGSIENLQRLGQAGEACEDDLDFALIQDGIEWPEDQGLELIARLPAAESLFVLTRRDRSLTRFTQLQGMRVGVGPAQSGTARITHQILKGPGFETLGVNTKSFTYTDQIKALTTGELDAAFFVMDEDADLMIHAIREMGLDLAAFEHMDVIARRFPFASVGVIQAGQYDPVAVLPSTDRTVIRIDTLVVGNGCASVSETNDLLVLLADVFPTFVRHNRAAPPSPLQNETARTFFENGGPRLVDQYFPWLVDIMPLSNWLHIVMIVSVLFNVMGIGHRFRLWRLDTARVKLELYLPVMAGAESARLATLEPRPEHFLPEYIARVDEILSRFEELRRRCRRSSLSILVPMGTEMAYRYQEEIIDRHLRDLRAFRDRLG